MKFNHGKIWVKLVLYRILIILSSFIVLQVMTNSVAASAEVVLLDNVISGTGLIIWEYIWDRIAWVGAWRYIVKTIAWRTIGTFISGAAAYVITGSMAEAGVFAVAVALLSTTIYFTNDWCIDKWYDRRGQK